jgi:hypothetical protein
MTEQHESGEEDIEGGQNPTQQRIDSDGGPDDAPVDVGWDTEATPHEGEEGQEPA